MIRLTVVVVLLVTAACAAPASRLSLPVPYLPTNGATTIPGNGVGIGYEVGSGLLGPELALGNVRGSSVGLGIKDRVSISLGNPRSRGTVENHTMGADLQQLRAKAVLLKPGDSRPAVALYAGYSWGDFRLLRRLPAPSTAIDTLQNDRVRSWEVAMPVEFLLGTYGSKVRTSIFGGPRLTSVKYHDAVRPEGSFQSVVPGMVGGLHFSAHMFEIFLESTVAYVGGNGFLGGSGGGRLAVMPAIGAVFRIGPAYRWK